MSDIEQVAVSLNTRDIITLDGVLSIEPMVTILYSVNTGGSKLNVTFSYVHFRGTIDNLSSPEVDEDNFDFEWDGAVEDQYDFASITDSAVKAFINNEIRRLGFLLTPLQIGSLVSKFRALTSTGKWSIWDFNRG